MQTELLRAKTDAKHQTRQILYIDDEPSISVLVAYSLQTFAHWQVITADGLQAPDIAKTGSWDTIVLEIALFDGAGVTVYEQLKNSPQTQATPLILLTSKVMPSDLRKYHQMDIVGVIAKPFDPVTLGSQISDLLGWCNPENATAAAWN